jgi:putative transposase
MSQSLVRNYIHLVFSTRHREPFIDETLEDELHRYISGICRDMQCPPVQTGGTSDHLHTLFSLNKNTTLVRVVEQIKSHSSSWMKTKGEEYSNFYWQKG